MMPNIRGSQTERNHSQFGQSHGRSQQFPMLQFSDQEQPQNFANEIRVEEDVGLGVGHSTILDMNESIPQDDENSHTIDMRFSAFPESS